MTSILAFDTSNSSLSVALLKNEEILAQNLILENGKQSESLIPEIENLLRQQNIWYQDLDLIATTNGPGSFTGVRIGLTAARTMNLATQIPLILLNSLEIIAYKYRKITGRILVVLDAKMDEFFIGEFLAQNNKIIQVKAPSLIKADEILKHLPQEGFLLVGSGKKIVTDLIKNSSLTHDFSASDEDDFIEGGLIGLLAYEKLLDQKASENFDPLYLRDPKIGERKK